MLRVFFCVLLLASSAFAQTDKAQAEVVKKETALLRAAVDNAVGTTVTGMGYLQMAKATYLDGYGIVVTFEVSLAPTINPFSGPVSPADVRKVMIEKRMQIQQKLENILKQQTPSMKSVGADQSVSIVIYLINSNPAAIPDLPAQIVMTAKKPDPDHVSIREY